MNGWINELSSEFLSVMLDQGKEGRRGRLVGSAFRFAKALKEARATPRPRHPVPRPRAMHEINKRLPCQSLAL